MLQLILKIILIVMLAILFVQDIKRREVSFYLLLATFIVAGLLGFSSKSINPFEFGFNVLFIILQVSFILLYLYFTGRKPAQLLKDYLGIGDILFWLIPALYFKPIEFILFSLFCYIAIVLGFGILFIIKHKSITIPLAGLMALFMAIYMVASWESNGLLSNLVANFITI